jgi:glycosyltransferase involved in cell wall biosynthesis
MRPANPMPAAPNLSVIVVCKNPGRRLRAALDSVWEQRHVHVEIVVVDGDSGDGSREWLESERWRIATLVSEPDGGVYDAMNKGIARARGEWIYFLGSDDRLAGNMVLSETVHWMKQTEAGVVAGNVAFDDGRIYTLHSRVNTIARNFVHHQAAFYRRTLFEENGGFDTSLAMMADFDFNLRLWERGVRFTPIPLRIAVCGTGGISDSGDWRSYREEMSVRHRHFPLLRALPWDALSIVRFLRKQGVGRSARGQD